MARTPLTSTSNPLRIAELPVGAAGGRIGITFAPGKHQPNGLTGAHRRDLGADLYAIAAWNAAPRLASWRESTEFSPAAGRSAPAL